MSRTYDLTELAGRVGGVVRGASDVRIDGVSTVSEAGPTQVCWAIGLKYLQRLAESSAGVVLVSEGEGASTAHRVAPHIPLIACTAVHHSVALLLEAFAPPRALPDLGIHPSAHVDPSAVIGDGCRIAPHVTVMADARVGQRCILHPGAMIGEGSIVGDDCELQENSVVRQRCTLGARVILQPGACVGSDGFGYYFHEGRHCKVPHIGDVVIGDDVEIGANSAVDRSKFGSTVIGAGTKIDNLSHVAHNVRIGRHCVFAGQTAISGSSSIGDYCVFGGRAGTYDNVTIGDRVHVAGMAVCPEDVPAGTVVGGLYGEALPLALRMRVASRKLPELLSMVRQLERRVKELEASANNQSPG